MKRIGLVAAALAISLSGCGLFHEHQWQDATCEQAKICLECGKEEGNALGHQFSEANYQIPATCSICQLTEGEVLTPDFEIYELKADAEADIDGWYDYYTCGNGKTDIEVVGKLQFLNFKVFASDETHEAKEGYEWRTVEALLTFSDEKVLTHGAEWSTSWDDYYNIEKHDSTATVIDEDGITYRYTVNYNGVDYTDCIFIKDLNHSGWEGNNYVVRYEFSFQVPIGYDG